MTSTRKFIGMRSGRLALLVMVTMTLAAGTSSMSSKPPRSTRATAVIGLAAQTEARVTPTAVTGAAGYLWMVGAYPCSTGTCSVLMRSSDGGRSFVRSGTLPAASYRIEFANREDGYAFGSGGPDDQSRLYWTGDGGESWRFALARFRYSPPQVVVITDGRAYVLVATDCSAKGLCKSVQLASSPVTSDTWTATPLPLTVGEVEKQFGWAAFDSNVWVIVPSVSNARLLVSHNGGRTFSKLRPGGYLGALGCNLTATSPTTLWGSCATGNGGYAIRSTDGGKNFLSVRTPGGMSNDILIYPTSDSEAIFYPLSGNMWLTRDGGRHFTSLLRIPHGSEYNCQVALASARTWLVFGFSGYRPNTFYLMWRTTNGGGSWQLEEAPTVTTAASTAYCNASQLRLGFFGSGVGNPGQAVTAVRVTDTSSFPCSLRGHPVVTFLGKAGAIMRVTVEQAPSSVFYGAVRTIVLPPRKAAWAGFVITSNDFPAEGTSCPTAAWIRVRLPNIAQPFIVTAPVRLCRLLADISPIVKGAVVVSAL